MSSLHKAQDALDEKGDLEEALRLAEVGEFLYSACAYSYGDGYTEPREYGVEWQWQQSKPDEYGQGHLLASAVKWHSERAEDGIATEAAKLRATLESLSRQLNEAEAKIGEASRIIRDTLWMAQRYANGRMSYAVGMYNDAARKAMEDGFVAADRDAVLWALDGMDRGHGAYSSLSEQEFEDAHNYRDGIKAAEARIASLAGALDYLFDTEGGSDGRPRIVDACYTAFQIAKSPNVEDGGASDWFNDTRPAILKIIAKMKEAIASLPTAGEKGDGLASPKGGE